MGALLNLARGVPDIGPIADAVNVSQIEVRTSESATTTETAELRVLVNQVADYNGFTPEDRQEALEIAMADSTSALECFRALAARLPVARCLTARS